MVATVRQQFYLVLLDRALIGVQEESVRLLQSQLQDQQNRFEAGTVPRFNVLQAQVALSNQLPQLITARNNYPISQLQLAKTLGLDFDPSRGDRPPLEAVGELIYVPREMPVTQAIAVAKENRPFLKQQKATVLSNSSQVGVARSGYFPQISALAGSELRSSPFTDNIRASHSGYVFGATATWAIWDWGATFGAVKQAKAILEESKVTLDDDVRQVELEVQQAFANVLQGRELIKATEKSVEQAAEALRLATARLDAGAGTQLEVLDARTQLTTAQSNRLQALYTYNAAVAEFDRATATEVKYSVCVDEPRTRAKLHSEAQPTPAPKPTPLPLTGDCGRRRSRGPRPKMIVPLENNELPLEAFPALQHLGCKHGFVRRVPGIELSNDKAVVLANLDQVHRASAADSRLLVTQFAIRRDRFTDEKCAVIDSPSGRDHCFEDCDGLITNQRNVCLGHLCRRLLRGLSGRPQRARHWSRSFRRKGTELKIVRTRSR